MGEIQEPETHRIPLAKDAAMGKGPELHLFGTDYASVDGTAVRDYVHVSDLASAHVLAVRYLEQGGNAVFLGPPGIWHTSRSELRRRSCS